MRHRAVALLLPLAAACSQGFDLPAKPPPPPPPGPGSVTGRLVVAEAGTSRTAPAAGARVQILRTNVSAISGAEGRFVLSPIADEEGTILIQLDADADGDYERQKLLALREIGAGPGRDVSLGDIVLKDNATIRGRVLLDDRIAERTGHGGVTVFVPEGPFTTYSGDDGSYLFLNVPEGAITLAFFRQGYAPASLDAVEVRAGEALTFRDVVLEPSLDDAPQGTIAGEVRFSPAVADASLARVAAANLDTEVVFPVGADGKFTGTVAIGLFRVSYAHGGYEPVTVPNVLVLAGQTSRIPAVTLSPAQQHLPGADAGPPQELNPPVARITSPTIGRTGGQFQLDGTASSAPQGHPFTYKWRQTAGDPVTLSPGATAPQPRFVAPLVAQTLQFELAVTDVVTGLNAIETTSIALAQPPGASIAALESAPARSTLVLDAGASTGPAGHPLLYSWRISAGEAVLLGLNDSTDAVVTSALLPATEQKVVFSLTVTDLETQLTATASALVDVYEMPEARISAVPAAATSRSFQLSGAGSIAPGGRALHFLWDQTLGEPVALSVNDSSLAAAPTFVTPAAPQRLGFVLTATDVLTGLADTAGVEIEIVAPPVARIRPTALTVRPNTLVLISGDGSSDPRGAPISYQWSIQGAGAAVEAPSTLTSRDLKLRMGAEQVVAQLVVSNGLVSSEPASLAVLVDDSAIVNPTLSASAGRVVGYGETVTLTASAAHPNLAETLSFTWTQDAGTELSLTRNSTASSSSAVFVSPRISTLLRFTVRVDASGGGSASSSIYIEVQDKSPPVIVDSDPAVPNGSGSPFHMSVTFDEPVDPVSAVQQTSLDANVGGVLSAVGTENRYDAATRTVTLIPKSPLVPGGLYHFNVGAVKDLAPVPNAHEPAVIPFHARAPLWRLWSSTGVSSRAPIPGLAVTPREVVVMARRGDAQCNGSWMLSPDAGSALVTQNYCVSFDLTCTGPVLGKRGLVSAGQIYGFVGAPCGYGASHSGMLFRRNGASWQTIEAASMGSMIADDTGLYGVSGDNYSLRFRIYNASGNTWSETIFDTTAFAYDVGNVNMGSRDGEILISAHKRTTPNHYLVVLRRSTAGVWSQLMGTLPSGGIANNNSYAQSRPLFARGQPFVVHGYTSGGPTIHAAGWDATTDRWVSYNNVPGGAGVGFDAIARGDTVYVALIKGSGLYLRRLDLAAAAPAWEDVPGPTGAMLSTSGCQADHPELAMDGTSIWLTWDETCTTNQWRVHLRRLY